MKHIFNVLGVNYELFVSEEIPDGLRGICDPYEKTIRVTSLESKSQEHIKDFMLTLLHEVTHATDFENGIFQAIGPQLMEILAETHAKVLVENFDIKLRHQPKPRPQKSKRPAARGKAR